MASSTSGSGVPQLPQGTTEQWDAYAHGGGVEEDDMRVRAKMRQEEAEYLGMFKSSQCLHDGGKFFELVRRAEK